MPHCTLNIVLRNVSKSVSYQTLPDSLNSASL